MNIFERRMQSMLILGLAGIVLVAGGIGGMVAVGLLVDPDSAWILLPTFAGFIPGLFGVIFGFVFRFSYKYNHRIAKMLFDETEISKISTPMFLNIAAAEKAKRLLHEGKKSGDLSEYEEFREIAMISIAAGRYGARINI